MRAAEQAPTRSGDAPEDGARAHDARLREVGTPSRSRAPRRTRSASSARRGIPREAPMPTIPVESEPLPINMTPMIDIVFNLVTFFMLTLDLSHKELAALDLPRAHSGTPDEPVAKEAERRITVNLVSPGNAMFRGTTYPLAAQDPATAANALSSLTSALATAVRTDVILGKKGPLVVVLRGDRAVPWRRVAWVIEACADPSIRPATVRFSVDGPGEKRPEAK